MSTTRNQYLAAFCANLLAFGYGLAASWTSAAIPLLQSPESPLGALISNDDAALIGSVLPIGGLTGTLIFGCVMNKLGRKRSIFLLAFPQIIGWFMLYFAESKTLLIAFRYFAGTAAGGMITVVPVYVSEISEDRLRGFLGSSLVLFYSLGLLLAYVFGAFLPYFLIPWVSMPSSVLFLLGFYHMPESPTFLVQKGRHEEAEKSLKFFRGIQDCQENVEVRNELDRIISSMEANQSSLTFSNFKGTHARKALLYGVFLVVLYNFTGCFAMQNFFGAIFKQLGSTFPPNISSIIIGLLQVAGSIVCTFAVEKAGRKLLFVISSFGSALGFAVFSCYTFSTSRGVDLSNFTWIPLLSFSFVIFISNWGILTLPFLYISEVIPRNIKSFSMTFCLSLFYVFSAIVLQSLLTSVELIGIHGTTLIFSINSLIGTLVIVLFLPETKGKSYEEILKLFEERN